MVSVRSLCDCLDVFVFCCVRCKFVCGGVSLSFRIVVVCVRIHNSFSGFGALLMASRYVLLLVLVDSQFESVWLIG